MEISFYGSSLVSAYWNGAATYYRGLIRALAARGHSITFFEPDAYDRQQHRDMADPLWARVVVYAATPAGVSSALEQGARADVLIKASGVGVFDDFLEKQILLGGQGAIHVYWDVDAPATLARIRENPDDHFRRLIPKYDLILTYGGGTPVVDSYLALGARACVPVYNAVDPDIHHRTTSDPRFDAALGLLANRLPDRERRVEEFFLAAARLRPQDQFILGGAGWESKQLPPNVRHLGHVYTRDHNAFNSTAKAVLNVSRETMALNGWSPATRVFEAAGAGACIISDLWPGLEDFLEPGSEVLVANSGDEVAALLDAITPAAAQRVGERARVRVLSQHTYANRAVQVEKILTGFDRARPTGTF